MSSASPVRHTAARTIPQYLPERSLACHCRAGACVGIEQGGGGPEPQAPPGRGEDEGVCLMARA